MVLSHCTQHMRQFTVVQAKVRCFTIAVRDFDLDGSPRNFALLGPYHGLLPDSAVSGPHLHHCNLSHSHSTAVIDVQFEPAVIL